MFTSRRLPGYLYDLLPVAVRGQLEHSPSMAEGQRRLDPRVLGDLLQVLTCLKTNDGYLHQDLFLPQKFMKAPLQFYDLPTARAQFQDFLILLHTLKAFTEVLRCLLESVTNATSALQIRSRPLSVYVGIHTLPNELLSQIFEQGFSQERVVVNGDLFSVHVSHVCRRFRAVALNTPTIWTALTNAHWPDQLEAYIQRSKAANLLVSINEDGNSRQLLSQQLSGFLDAVVPHARRWGEFRYRHLWETEAEDREALSRFPNLKLPMLSSLTLDPISDDNVFESSLGSHWRTPRLHHFHGNNVLPQTAWGFTLKTCFVSLDAIDISSLDLFRLLSSLQTTPHLERLHLTSRFSGRISNAKYPTVTLKNLRHLCIRINSATTPDCALIPQYLYAPALTTLSLELGIPETANPSDWTGDTRHPASILPESLELRVSFNHKFPSDMAIEYILASLPTQRLKHLSVQAPTLLLNEAVRRRIPQTLRTLQFKYCDKLDISNVKKVFETPGFGSRVADWESLEKLEIIGIRGNAQKFYLDQLRTLLGDRFVCSTS